MNKIWKVGLFAPNREYLDEIMKYTYRIIKDRNETIIKTVKSKDKPYIETDKSWYEFRTPVEGVRGYKWHELFIFDSQFIDEEILDVDIISKLIPYDIFNCEEYDYRKYIHYLDKN